MIPLIQKPDLYHLGTMDPAQSNPESYEGHLLSVSEDPDAWRRIAKLGGRDEWHLSCPNAWFVDVHACREDKETWNAFLFWADSKGLVEFVDCHVAIWYDDEFERDMAQRFASREALDYEHDEDIEEGNVEVEVKANTPRLTEKGMQRYELTHRDSAWSVDYAFPDWVRAKFAANDARIKGLWWDDEDDPDTLLAPRGGIFPEKLELFEIQNLTQASAPRP